MNVRVIEGLAPGDPLPEVATTRKALSYPEMPSDGEVPQFPPNAPSVLASAVPDDGLSREKIVVPVSIGAVSVVLANVPPVNVPARVPPLFALSVARNAFQRLVALPRLSDPLPEGVTLPVNG